jgi:inactivated superfamily I helicase
LTREVERFSLSRQPRAADWARHAAQVVNGKVVLGGLDGLTRGIVAWWENPSPSQGDLVVGSLLGDVRSIAEHEMKVMGSKLQTSHKDDLTQSRKPAEGEKTQMENIRRLSGMN